MNKEQLEARLKQLETEMLVFQGRYEGAIQDCKYWLDQLNTKEEDVQTNAE